MLVRTYCNFVALHVILNSFYSRCILFNKKFLNLPYLQLILNIFLTTSLKNVSSIWNYVAILTNSHFPWPYHEYPITQYAYILENKRTSNIIDNLQILYLPLIKCLFERIATLLHYTLYWIHFILDAYFLTKNF